MRGIPSLLVLAFVLAAGCSAPADPVTPGAAPGRGPADDAAPADPAPAPEARPEPSAAPAAPEEPTFCESEAACAFWDDDYHEFALYEVDTATIDVLVVPSASPTSAQDTATIRAAIDAWAAGIEALAAPWFADALDLRVHVLGEDAPQEALNDPEIIVVAAEYNPAVLFGIGEQLPVNVCRGEALETYPTHRHDGMIVRAARCESGGLTCVALNTNFLLGTKEQLYDLVAHEFGHCLGGGHVGDALDFSAKRVPVHDIMSYQHDETQVHCVSNLNVRVLEALYAPVLGVTPAVELSPGDFLTMPRSSYSQVICANP
ncbi:MAG TPA: hypothetical protein VM370_04140 [Candidatus Thermoplasmatota archaeon]|nr:hypothetical protein [Candidatus Thermoplasmatota archaeon]